MSNNPLEAVTQAVNSLVTALKLPDESAKANEVLGEMSSRSSAVCCRTVITTRSPACS